MIRTQIKPQGHEYGASTFSAYYDAKRRVMVIQHNDTQEEWDIAAYDKEYARTHENPAKSCTQNPNLAVFCTNARKGEQE